MKDNSFKIIIPFYNTEKWINNCIQSVKKQNYLNYQCFIIDDMSTDNSESIIKELIQGDDKFFYIKNQEKKYALKNIYDTIKETRFDNNDIVVLLDGDDWFATNQVLTKLNEVYTQKNCWMTYGSYVEFPMMKKGLYSQETPKEVIEQASYRQEAWRTSHLRTFKVFLWNSINYSDFLSSRTNMFVKAAWDLAFMFPMLEMSYDKVEYISDIMYVYNRANPLSEDKINHDVQLGEEYEIRNKKKYERLFR